MKESGKSKLHATLNQMKGHLPVLFAIGLFVVSISMWIFLGIEEEKHYKNLMAQEVNTIKTLITYDLNQSILSLERLKLRWEDELYSEKKQWLSDTKRIVTHREELLAIEWVDKDYIVRWIEPFEVNKDARDLNLSFEERRKKTLDLAKRSGETAVTELIELVQGGKGFLSVSPIFIDGKFDGFILGVFEVKKVLSSFVEELATKGVTIQFINFDDPAIKEEVFFNQQSSRWNIRTVLKFRHLRIGTIFSFDDSFFPSKVSRHSDIIGVSGILLSVIFSMRVYFNKMSKSQSGILVKEIAEKDKFASQLEGSEKKFRTYFELTLIGMAITSLEKGWLEVNDKLCEILGYPREELVKLKWVDIAYPVDAVQDAVNFNQMVMGEIDGYSLGTRFIRKDKKVIHASISVRAVRDSKGDIDYFLTLVQDISERIKYEEELKSYRNHLEKLVKERTSALEKTHTQLIHSEKLSATGKLAATMAHEINNPICGIRNVLEGIYERADLKDKEKILARMAIGECNRIANLVKDLNDFNRPSPATPELMDVNSIISDLLLLEIKKLKNKHIALELNYASDLPKVAIITDQFKQVILNLLNNAEDSVDEDREDGKIAITTESKDSKVMIHVSDNGYGISEDILAHIFEPFVTTKSAVKGVGLGLSVSYGIIKAHGGDIVVESALGKGSTFSVILPVNEKS